MNARRRQRGEPLIMLGALMCGWVGLRAALWEPPFRPAEGPGIAEPVIGEYLAPGPARRAGGAGRAARHAPPAISIAAPPRRPEPLLSDGMLPPLSDEADLMPHPSLAETHPGAGLQPGPTPAHTPSMAAAHQIMWMAAISASATSR